MMKKSNAGRDEHGAPRFYKAGLLGGPCAVCRRDGRRRRVGPSAGSCPVFPGITARHSDGGIWLLPAVPACRRAGAVRRGGPAHRPALARAVRCRGTGRLRGAGRAFFQRAAQARRARAHAVHLRRLADFGRGRGAGFALCMCFRRPAWPPALCLLLGHRVFYCGTCRHRPAETRLGPHAL